jgi:hypothetical protein
VLVIGGTIAGALFSHFVLFPSMMAFFRTFDSPRMRFMPRVEDTFALYKNARAARNGSGDGSSALRLVFAATVIEQARRHRDAAPADDVRRWPVGVDAAPRRRDANIRRMLNL